jgi:serine/threonine-protein kinase HipA
VLFNLLIGNCDANGKNISWNYSTNDISVTPFYDMLSISIYGNKYNQNLAMAVGDNFSAKVYAYDLSEMCEACELQPRFVSRTLEKMTKAVFTETDTLLSGLDRSGDESDFATKLIFLLKANAKWYAEVARELPHIRH